MCKGQNFLRYSKAGQNFGGPKGFRIFLGCPRGGPRFFVPSTQQALCVPSLFVKGIGPTVKGDFLCGQKGDQTMAAP